MNKIIKTIKLINKILDNNLNIAKALFSNKEKSKRKMITEIIKYKAKYHINLEDYYSFRFYNMTEEQVSTFFTYGMNNSLVDRLNDKKKKKLFENKSQFDGIFNEYLGRKWLKSNAPYTDFVKFAKNLEYIFYKRLDGNRGIGAKKINVHEYNNDLYRLYEDIQKLDIGILEELIEPHKDIRRLCGDGLSTIRLITINLNGKLVLLDSVFMMMNGGIVNCEVTGGGLSACIDVSTGKVLTDGVNANREFYKKHPITQKPIKGFIIPYWNEVLRLAQDIYDKVPGVNYIGWDIAITNNGPIVIEGNASWPSHRIWQVPYLREKHGKKNDVLGKLSEKAKDKK